VGYKHKKVVVMEHKEQKNMNKDNRRKILTNLLNYVFKEKIWVGSIVIFIISIIVNAVSATTDSKISFPMLLFISFFVTLIVFAFLSPILIIPFVRSLRRFIIDEEVEEKNLELSKKLSELTRHLQISSGKLDKSIDQNDYYFKEVIIPHIDDCSRIDNLVRRSYMINDIDMYYQKLIEARQKINSRDVYLTNFSTGYYQSNNENRNKYYSTDFNFIKNISCKVFRIVTVHSPEKLLFLRELFKDAIKSESLKYHLAYLDIEEFSNENDDILPGIVGMDIIGNEVIIMDFRYARALRKNDGFENPLYIESEEIAHLCREYYKMIWNDISNETPTSKRRYQGYVLYNGATRKVHDDMDNIWKKIESRIPVKNQNNGSV